MITLEEPMAFYAAEVFFTLGYKRHLHDATREGALHLRAPAETD
jgi:hypothetical protein